MGEHNEKKLKTKVRVNVSYQGGNEILWEKREPCMDASYQTGNVKP